MGKKKYKWTHLLNGKEVEKGDFFRHLGMHCVETIVYDPYNPITNVDLVDYEKTRKLYNRLKRTGMMQIFWSNTGSETFQIKRERL